MALKPPIHGCIRLASALVGTVIGAVGVWQVLSATSSRALGFLFIGWAVVMWFPAFARAAATRRQVEQRWRRVVVPALLCLLLGFTINGASWLIDRGHFRVRNAPNVARELLTFGSALWLIGFVLLLFAIYYTSQLDDEAADMDDDNGAG